MIWEYTIELQDGTIESGFVDAADEKEVQEKIRKDCDILFIEISDQYHNENL